MKLKGQPSGALVGEVSPKTPSEKAGIKTRDVITAVNAKKISDARELRLMIGSMAPDQGAVAGESRRSDENVRCRAC
jgi:S1-C subfamily serine protease